MYFLKLVKPESLNECFIKWIESIKQNQLENFTIALDKKTIRSTAKMDCYKNLLYIVSEYISELDMTFA